MADAVKPAPAPVRDELATALISMRRSEKERLTAAARTHGLSLSAFLRMAASEFIQRHKWE